MAKHASAETRKQQFLMAALQVLAERGYAKTRMSDIAAAAGLSKGSLYYHFPSKEALFLGLIEAHVQESRQRLETELSRHDSVAVALRHSLAGDIDHFGNDPRILDAVIDFYMLVLRKEGFRQKFVHYYEQAIQLIGDAIALGIERGEFKTNIDPHYAARLLVMAGDGISVVCSAVGRQKHFGEDVLNVLEMILTFLRDDGGVSLPVNGECAS